MDFQRGNALRVLALTRYGRMGASSRMRIYQYVPFLQTLDIDVQVMPLLRDDYLKRLYQKQPTNWIALFVDYLKQVVRLLGARKFDLVWIEKELFPNFPAWFERALSGLGICYVVDYDDAIFHNYDLSQQPLKRMLSKKIDNVMRSAELVVCGNNYLAERARSAGAHQVEIVPTVIDLDRYEVTDLPIREKIVVGWVGSPATAKYLDLIAPALVTLATKFSFQLRVIGASFTWDGLDVDCHPWSEESESREIQDFDIGVMPLADSPWEQGKCGYKLIQYMACGKPVVASPVGVNREIVRHGVNGYIASTVDEWASAGGALFSNLQSRIEMGQQGRKAVEEKYCLQVTAPRLARLFHAAAIKGVS